MQIGHHWILVDLVTWSLIPIGGPKLTGLLRLGCCLGLAGETGEVRIMVGGIGTLKMAMARGSGTLEMSTSLGTLMVNQASVRAGP